MRSSRKPALPAAVQNNPVPEEIIPQIVTRPTPAKADPAWGYAEIGLVICTFIAALFLCGGVGLAIAKAIVPGLTPQQVAANPLFFAPLQFAAYLLTFLALRFAVVSKSEEGFWQAIHWQMPAGEALFRYVLIGVVMAVVVQVLATFLPFPKSLPMQQYFKETGFAYMMTAFGLLVAPMAEELFFRGLAFPVLARTMGQVAAVAVTSAAFSLMHQGQLARAWAPLMVLFGVGVVLTTIRARTKSVASSWITHVAYNGTLFATLFLYSNGFRNLQ